MANGTVFEWSTKFHYYTRQDHFTYKQNLSIHVKWSILAEKSVSNGTILITTISDQNLKMFDFIGMVRFWAPTQINKIEPECTRCNVVFVR